MSSDYTLGQPVTFTTHLIRGWGNEADGKGSMKEWRPQPILGKLTPPRTGIVIGKRTLTNGRYDYGDYEEPGVYTAREWFTAYLVVASMSSKPVHVLPEHLAPNGPDPEAVIRLLASSRIDGDDPDGTIRWAREQAGATPTPAPPAPTIPGQTAIDLDG